MRGMSLTVPLRDVPVSRPKILFAGINPSLPSEAVGHHFAGPGNPFWRLLRAASLIPEPLTYAEDERLSDGMAITKSLPARHSLGLGASPRRVRAWQTCPGEEDPPAASRSRRLFVGVILYRRFFGRARLGSPGPGLKPDELHGARVFVLPNPSGLNASFPSFASKLRWFKRLRAEVGR